MAAIDEGFRDPADDDAEAEVPATRFVGSKKSSGMVAIANGLREQ